MRHQEQSCWFPREFWKTKLFVIECLVIYIVLVWQIRSKLRYQIIPFLRKNYFLCHPKETLSRMQLWKRKVKTNLFWKTKLVLMWNYHSKSKIKEYKSSVGIMQGT